MLPISETIDEATVRSLMDELAIDQASITVDICDVSDSEFNKMIEGLSEHPLSNIYADFTIWQTPKSYFHERYLINWAH